MNEANKREYQEHQNVMFIVSVNYYFNRSGSMISYSLTLLTKGSQRDWYGTAWLTDKKKYT